MDNKRILFIVTSADRIGPNNLETGYYFSEVSHPYLVFTANGHHVDFASIKGGEPPMVAFDESDTSNVIFRDSDGFARLNQSAPLADTDSAKFDAVYFPGGHGPMVDMVDNPVVKQAIARAYEEGGVIGAVCHGPAALLGVTLSDGSSLLEGRKVSSFSREEEEQTYGVENVPFILDEALKREGVTYLSDPPLEPHVVTDGRLVTGQNPASAVGLAAAMLEAMNI